MTSYQQELMRKLPHYGCIGSYSENEETLSFSYNGIKIGWMEKDGSVCGVVDEDMPEDADDMFFTIRDRARLIREYVSLYESSPPMGVPDVKEYRRFAEYGDTVLAGMYSEQHGFMFTTWEQSNDKSYVTHGDYSPSYAYVKEAFAVRAGLIDKNRVFSDDEAADLYRCVDYAKYNCETLTYEQERQLDSLAEKLQYGYPQLEESLPSFEQDDAPQLNM